MITLKERLASVCREIDDWAEGKPTNIMVTRYPELDVQGIRERLGMRFAAPCRGRAAGQHARGRVQGQDAGAPTPRGILTPPHFAQSSGILAVGGAGAAREPQ